MKRFLEPCGPYYTVYTLMRDCRLSAYDREALYLTSSQRVGRTVSYAYPQVGFRLCRGDL